MATYEELSQVLGTRSSSYYKNIGNVRIRRQMSAREPLIVEPNGEIYVDFHQFRLMKFKYCGDVIIDLAEYLQANHYYELSRARSVLNRFLPSEFSTRRDGDIIYLMRKVGLITARFKMQSIMVISGGKVFGGEIQGRPLLRHERQYDSANMGQPSEQQVRTSWYCDATMDNTEPTFTAEWRQGSSQPYGSPQPSVYPYPPPNQPVASQGDTVEVSQVGQEGAVEGSVEFDAHASARQTVERMLGNYIPRPQTSRNFNIEWHGLSFRDGQPVYDEISVERVEDNEENVEYRLTDGGNNGI